MRPALQWSAQPLPDRKPAVLTHPDKLLFNDPPLNKAALADYYRTVAPWLLAEASRRPLSIVRCPGGIGGDCFLQKHPGKGLPEAVHTVTLDDRHGQPDAYLWVDDVDGLLGLVQLDSIELHAWNCRVEDIDHADRLVFDLDPASNVTWNEVRQAARDVRAHLRKRGLASFVRSSGGKGLHVVAPIAPGPDWTQVKDFARDVAESMEAAAPERFLASAGKRQRQGRIFIDYLRNARGATAIVNYSVRARRGAPVATPLRWNELARLAGPARYTVFNLPRRLSQLGHDPWRGLDTQHPSLPPLH